MLADGTVVGEHDGYARYTIGQRRGVPGGFARANVRRGHPAGGSRRRHRPARRAARARRGGARDELARRRHCRSARRCRCRCAIARTRRPRRSFRLDGDEIELALEEPVSAITPGQSLVLYDGERVLGGGFIERGGAAARTAFRCWPPSIRRAGSDAPRTVAQYFSPPASANSRIIRSCSSDSFSGTEICTSMIRSPR